VKYKVVIKKPNALENFEKKRDNVATVSIRKKEKLSCEGERVNLFLSKSAMIGLGKSLIRWAKEKEKFKNDVLHFYRMKPSEDLVQNLGVFVASDSVEPIVGIENSETIDSIIKTQKG